MTPWKGKVMRMIEIILIAAFIYLIMQALDRKKEPYSMKDELNRKSQTDSMIDNSYDEDTSSWENMQESNPERCNYVRGR